MIQRSVAAATIINEIIAVILAKQAFKWAGEIPAKTPTAVSARQTEEKRSVKL